MKKIKKQKKLNRSQEENIDPLEGDLSDIIEHGEWKPMSDYFRFKPKNTTVTLRMPGDLVDHLKKMAEKQKTDYQKLIREAIIEYIIKRAC